MYVVKKEEKKTKNSIMDFTYNVRFNSSTFANTTSIIDLPIVRFETIAKIIPNQTCQVKWIDEKISCLHERKSIYRFIFFFL